MLKLKAEEILMEMTTLENEIKGGKNPEAKILLDLIFQFIHGKENLKKDLFIQFRNL